MTPRRRNLPGRFFLGYSLVPDAAHCVFGVPGLCTIIACSIRRFLLPNEGLGAASPAKAKAALEALPVATLEFNLDRTPNGQHSRFRDFAGQSGERRVENSPSPPHGGASNTCSPCQPANCL